MSELKLHANGKGEHLKSLVDFLTKKIQAIKSNNKLSETQKKAMVKKLKEEYKVDKNDSDQNLY